MTLDPICQTASGAWVFHGFCLHFTTPLQGFFVNLLSSTLYIGKLLTYSSKKALDLKW